MIIVNAFLKPFSIVGEVDIEEEDIVPLMAVADRFDIPELVDTCRQYFESEVCTLKN